jgi:tetratricopeptide (TPR) repeat protein
LALEKFEILLERAKKAESISGQIWALYAKGLAYAQMKSFGEALGIAKEIEGLIPMWMHKKFIRFRDHLVGMIAVERENFSDAILNLSRAVKSLYAPEDNFPRIQAFFIHALAQAYYKAGNLSSAQGEFEKILSLHLGRIGDGDFYARSLYSLGKISEQRGQREKAIEYYERFLGLWKDADPGLAEADDAKTRLAAIRKP